MKKNYGLRLSTNGRSVNIDYNEKFIKKAGNMNVFLGKDGTAQITVSDWTIAGHKRFKRLRRLFGKKYGQSCGILINGDDTSMVIQGESGINTFSNDEDKAKCEACDGRKYPAGEYCEGCELINYRH